MSIRNTYSWSPEWTRDESADLGSSISGSLGDQALTHRKRDFALVSRTPGVPAVSFLLPSALSAQSTVPKIVTGKHTPFLCQTKHQLSNPPHPKPRTKSSPGYKAVPSRFIHISAPAFTLCPRYLGPWSRYFGFSATLFGFPDTLIHARPR